MAFVRLREQELAGLKQLAEDLGETPRRLNRNKLPPCPPLRQSWPGRKSGILL